MGRPKPLVRVNGHRLLERTLERLRDAGLRSIVVVLGDRAAEVRAAVDLSGVTVAENPGFAEGMASSLRVGVAAAAPSAAHVMIVLADQPFVESDTLRRLATRAAQGDGAIFIPTYKGVWGNPVVFASRLAPEVERITGDIGCRAMFPHHTAEIREVPVEDPGTLVDIDTEAELAAVEAAMASGRPLRELLDRLAEPRWSLHASPAEHPVPKRLFRRGVPAERTERARGGTAERPVDPDRPKPELLIVGDSPVATSLAALAPVLGFRVLLVAPGVDASELPDVDERIADVDRLTPHLRPTTYAVVASMGKYDEAALAQIARAPVAFVGLVASRKRSQSVLGTLRAQGVTEPQVDRIRNPVGLDIGANTPEEIALSVLAEITRVRRSSPPTAPTPAPGARSARRA